MRALSIAWSNCSSFSSIGIVPNGYWLKDILVPKLTGGRIGFCGGYYNRCCQWASIRLIAKRLYKLDFLVSVIHKSYFCCRAIWMGGDFLKVARDGKLPDSFQRGQPGTKPVLVVLRVNLSMRQIGEHTSRF
jgi:hypothetical protein